MLTQGKTALLVAILFGICAMLALPPISLWPLIIPAYSGLFLLLLTSPSSKAAFWRGWLFGMGYFVPGLYWFAIALLTEPEKFAWMIPFAVLGIPSILSIYYGLAGLILHRVPLTSPVAKLFAFTAIWLLFEWLRGTLFTGFPWNPPSLSWASSTPMLQLSSLIGSYGLSWWTMLLATLPALALLNRTSSKTRQAALLGVLAMTLIQFGFGWLRLENNSAQFTDTTIRIVQGNIAQPHKWDPRRQMANVHRQMRITLAEGAQDVDIFIWAETAFPFIIQDGSPVLRSITEYLPSDSHLITGALRMEVLDGQIPKLWNSLGVVSQQAELLSYYDKMKLVPFGEFVPFRGILPVEKIAHGMQDFSHGDGHKAVTAQGMPPFLPQICYEGIFPEIRYENQRAAEWIVNVTNDGWFGKSIGPYQHLEMSRMRGIELGLPLARAANTGISAIYDSFGRPLKKLALGETGQITAKLPAALVDTPYSHIQPFIVWLILIINLTLIIILEKRTL